MIHHLSIAAHNPLHVAHVLAEVWQGQVFKFLPHPGGYIVVPHDQYGSAIEVYPLGNQLAPGPDQEAVQVVHQPDIHNLVATHAAISVPTSEAQIRQIADREGWRVVVCDRSAFKVIEFWIENRLMLELLTPKMAAQYLEFTQQPRLVEQVFGAPLLRDHKVQRLVSKV